MAGNLLRILTTYCNRRSVDAMTNLLPSLVEKLGLLPTKKILWAGVMISILLTEIIVAPMSPLFQGHVTYDYLITGAMTASVVSFIVIFVILRLNRKLQRLAYHDLLTDLPNRNLFQDRLNHVLQNARRNRTKLALLFLDLDDFKAVNDTLGHHIGDQLLKEVALRLKKPSDRAIRGHALAGMNSLC